VNGDLEHSLQMLSQLRNDLERLHATATLCSLQSLNQRAYLGVIHSLKGTCAMATELKTLKRSAHRLEETLSYLAPESMPHLNERASQQRGEFHAECARHLSQLSWRLAFLTTNQKQPFLELESEPTLDMSASLRLRADQVLGVALDALELKQLIQLYGACAPAYLMTQMAQSAFVCCYIDESDQVTYAFSRSVPKWPLDYVSEESALQAG